jgi:hypothetical protein
MAALENIKPNCAVRGILPSSIVTVVSAQWFGSDAIQLTYKDATGRVRNGMHVDFPRVSIKGANLPPRHAQPTRALQESAPEARRWQAGHIAPGVPRHQGSAARYWVVEFA